MITIETISVVQKGITANDWNCISGSLSFRWLGQAGFAFFHSDTLLFIDPYLSDFLAQKYKGANFPHKRMMPVPYNLSEIRGVNFVLCTHGHSDHMDPETLQTLATNNQACKFVVPTVETDKALGRGIQKSQLFAVDANNSYKLTHDISLTVIPSAHEQLQTNEKGEHYFLGYILTFGDLTIYHSGDCIPYAGLMDLLRKHRVSIAFLPVNGRDEYRSSHGVPGNFTAEEVVQIARETNIQCIIPCHFGMFDFNTIDNNKLKDALEGTEAEFNSVIPEIGKQYNIN